MKVGIDMALVLFGALIGLLSAIACAIAGDITFWQGFLIYWIVGSSVPLLGMSFAYYRADDA